MFGDGESKEKSFQWSKVDGSGGEDDVLKGIAGRVVYFHAKDLRGDACTALGEGEVKVAECIRILTAAGYDGTLSLETEGSESFEDSVSLARKSREFLLQRF